MKSSVQFWQPCLPDRVSAGVCSHDESQNLARQRRLEWGAQLGDAKYPAMKQVGLLEASA